MSGEAPKNCLVRVWGSGFRGLGFKVYGVQGLALSVLLQGFCQSVGL